MARRLCLDERARIEAMSQAGFSVAVIAERLGRHRSCVHRELAPGGGRSGCRSVDAQAAAWSRARRPGVAKLARDRVLAAAAAERLEMRWSPQAISADLRSQGLEVCSETVYRACYDRTRSRGLASDSWGRLPRRRRRRKPRGRSEQAKRSALGGLRPIAERPAQAAGRAEPG